MQVSQEVQQMYPLGQVVQYHFIWYFILVSYIVSFLGALTTVEILHRRKTAKGWRSWTQHVLEAVPFGLVAVWAMHFVGNRAITLGRGEPAIQLYYNPGWTALSAILPVVMLCIAFYITDRFFVNDGRSYVFLILAGFVAGLAILGMHYIGNVGIANYKLYNSPSHIVGSAAIAVTNCCLVLVLFFRQKELWINSFWRRASCAALLAGAVSGLHWLASKGTTYTLKSYYQGAAFDRNKNMIIAMIMCGVGELACFALAYFAYRRRKALADRARNVVLAAAHFDPDGKLLVSLDGLMPCKKITRKYNQRVGVQFMTPRIWEMDDTAYQKFQSFADEFYVAHKVYQWIFRVTYNWNAVHDLIPGMRAHLRTTGNWDKTPRPGSSRAHSVYDEPDNEDDYSTIFKEVFCATAMDLANDLEIPLEHLGTLYEDILMTGQTESKIRLWRSSNSVASASQKDLEANPVAPVLFGKGQLLFVTRRLDRQEAQRLKLNGYRFAEMEQVAGMLASSMQVERQDIIQTITKLRTYASREHVCSVSGVYLACFSLRPRPGKRGFDILVPKDQPSQLPQVRLVPHTLTNWQTQLLSRMNGCSLDQCEVQLKSLAGDVEERQFREMVLNRVRSLKRMLPEANLKDVTFAARPLKLPFYTAEGSGSASAIAFYGIANVHSKVSPNSPYMYTPFSFFQCRQRVYPGAPDHALFAGRVHREFGNLIAKHVSNADFLIPSGRKSSFGGIAISAQGKEQAKNRLSLNLAQMLKKPATTPKDMCRSDSSSERELFDSTPQRSDENTAPTLGGIMVSQDITVEGGRKEDSHIEMSELGFHSQIASGSVEEPTFVDVLFEMTCQKWQKS